MQRTMKDRKVKGTWFDEKGNIAIKEGVAQKDLKPNEELVQYGEGVIICQMTEK